MRDKFLTVTEVAKRWGCNRDLVLSWIHSGELPAMNFSRGDMQPRFKMCPDAIARFEKTRMENQSNAVATPKQPPSRFFPQR